MTDTLSPDSEIATPEPDLLEDLLRERGLKALYWHVGPPERVDEDDPEPTLVAELSVVYSNGRRPFLTTVPLDIDVIYGLVGQDEVPRASTEFAVDQLVRGAEEVRPAFLEACAINEEWATAIGTWGHTDGDLIRGAAARLDGDWPQLLTAIADVVDGIDPHASFTTTEMQLAAVAVRIAWDLL